MSFPFYKGYTVNVLIDPLVAGGLVVARVSITVSGGAQSGIRQHLPVLCDISVSCFYEFNLRRHDFIDLLVVSTTNTTKAVPASMA